MDKTAYRCHETFRLIVMSVMRVIFCVSRQSRGGLVYQKDKSMVQLWKYLSWHSVGHFPPLCECNFRKRSSHLVGPMFLAKKILSQSGLAVIGRETITVESSLMNGCSQSHKSAQAARHLCEDWSVKSGVSNLHKQLMLNQVLKTSQLHTILIRIVSVSVNRFSAIK